MQVWNSGATDAPAGLTVRLYGRRNGALVLLHEHVTAEPLAAGSSLEYAVDTMVSAVHGGLLAVVDEDHAIAECDEADNEARWEGPVCRRRARR